MFARLKEREIDFIYDLDIHEMGKQVLIDRAELEKRRRLEIQFIAEADIRWVLL